MQNCFLPVYPVPALQIWWRWAIHLHHIRPVKIICNISEELARVIREKSVDWPGVAVEIEPIRDYPTGSLTANIIGFLGPIPAALEEVYEDRGFIPNRDKIGYSGVETSLDDILLGKNGQRVVQIDVAGQVLRNLEPPMRIRCPATMLF